jgi:hypothetical protein
MNTTLLRRARRLFNAPDVPASTVRHNCRAWARSVAYLGDKWLIKNPIPRLQND